MIVAKVLVGAGILLIVAGLVYDTEFAGIPYQDPAPEMSAAYAYHRRVAYRIEQMGALTAVAGAVCGVAQLLIQRISRSGRS